MAEGSILIFHAGALGDFVLTFALPRSLSAAYPGARIICLTHPSKGQLAERFLGTGSANLDAMGWHTLHGQKPQLEDSAAELLESSDACYSFIGATDDQFAKNLRQLRPGMPVTCLAPQPPADFADHVTSWYGQQLEHTTLRPHYETALGRLHEHGLNATRSASNRILLHLGAGSVKKMWPLECFLDLAAGLIDRGHEVALMIGEAELERIPDRVLQPVRDRYPLLSPADYIELSAELLNCALLITNDNGPGHLSAVLGTPTLSLFGPTSAKIWRPIGPHAHFIQAETLSALPPSVVLEKAREIIS